MGEASVARNQIAVERLRTRAALEEFARLPFRIYTGRDAWWPPDVQHEVDSLAGRGPFAGFLEFDAFAGRRNGNLLARATAVVNRRHNEHWHEALGLVAHLEALEGEDAAAEAVIAAALESLRSRGMRFARSGFAAFVDYPYAIDNYGRLPAFLLRANPPSYHRHLKNAGFETERGHIDYTAELTPELVQRYEKLVDAAQRAGFAIQTWREYGFFAAIDAWTDVTNAAFARHWGWYPVKRSEVRPMLTSMWDTAAPDLSAIASLEDDVVGAVFSIPDLSPTLARVRPGVRIAPELGGGSRGALVNIGVVERARGRGIGLALGARSFLEMAKRSLRYAGYTLVLDDNWPSRRTAEALGARVTSNFVTYRRSLE
jgi:hypothetical protein